MKKYIAMSMLATLMISVLSLAIINQQQTRANIIKSGCGVSKATIDSICRYKSNQYFNKINYSKIHKII